MSSSSEYKTKWRAAAIAVSLSIYLAPKRDESNISDIAPYAPPEIHHDIESVPSGDTTQVPTFVNVDEDTRRNSMHHSKSVTQILMEKDIEAYRSIGGLGAIQTHIRTNSLTGISEDDLRGWGMIFGSNCDAQLNLIKRLTSEAFQELRISNLLLLVCAILILVFGILGDVKRGWFDGGIIMITLFLSSVISGLVNLWIGSQLYKLKINNDARIEVVRNGTIQRVFITGLVVGDVVSLTAGDKVPADGLFIEGDSLHVDESGMTGNINNAQVNADNPFLSSGSKVVRGRSTMLVTSMGTYTNWVEKSPLQEQLDKLTSSLDKVGFPTAVLMLLAMLIWYFMRTTEDDYGFGMKWYDNDVYYVGSSLMFIISTSLSTLIVAVADLDLAYGVALVHLLKRMKTAQVLVRKHAGCENMGLATVICTDKAGTLTINPVEVCQFYVGQIVQNSSQVIEMNLLESLHQGVWFNTTGTVHKTTCEYEYSGSPTEKAILEWGVDCLGMDIKNLSQNYTILHVQDFMPEKRQSGVLIRKTTNSNYSIYVHWKGAAEMMLALCSSYYEHTGEVKIMSETERSRFEEIIERMARTGLICIAFAQKKLELEETFSAQDEMDQNHEDLRLLAIIGMKNPCRLDAKQGIESCEVAGVGIKMMTGDNAFTAMAIATNCGILKDDQPDAVIKGSEFKNYTPEERKQNVNNIHVMARSSPEDKLLMVQCLKQEGHVVAVIGDAHTLKEADVGLSMKDGTEVITENSDIVILNSDFKSVATVINGGRSIYINVQKFVQYQLTITISSLAITLISAVSGRDTPLTVYQSLFVEMIGKLVALVASERPHEDLMHNSPVGRKNLLITNVMWRNILTQAIYQIAAHLLLIYVFEWAKNPYIADSDEVKADKVRVTIIFNTFVLCQVFNLFNSRMLEKKNILKGIHKSKSFLGVIATIIIVQVLMVQFSGVITDTVRLSLAQWGKCVAIASMTLPLGVVIKLVPVTKKPLLSYVTNHHTLAAVKFLDKVVSACGLN